MRLCLAQSAHWDAIDSIQKEIIGEYARCVCNTTAAFLYGGAATLPQVRRHCNLVVGVPSGPSLQQPDFALMLQGDPLRRFRIVEGAQGGGVVHPVYHKGKGR